MSNWYARALVLIVVVVSAVPSHAQVAYSWGANGQGQLGNGTFANGNTPGPVNVLTSGVTVVAGGSSSSSFAIRNGAIYSWGANPFGQLGYAGGTQTSPNPVPGMSSGVTAIANGTEHTLAIQNGALFSWGGNGMGELGRPFVFPPETPRAVPTLSSGVTAVAAGLQMSLVIQNGAAYSFGLNDVGQLGLGTTNNTPNQVPTVIPSLSSGVTHIDAKFKHSAAIQNGGLFAWGDNFRGQLGNGTNGNSSSPVAVNGMASGVTDVSVGNSHTLAVQNGVAFAWGNNDNGQLGTGQFMPSTNVPVAVPGLPTNVIEVEAALFNSYALTADRRLFAWGLNDQGQVGNGTFDPRYTPVEIFAPNGFSFVTLDGGGGHVVAILTPVPEPTGVLAVAAVAFFAVRIIRRRFPSPTPEVRP
jgi:alpha-tubulin suppressor-like RCC1 family protein